MGISKDQWNSLFEYYGFAKEDEKNYPVVSGILKKLTPERIKEENEKIRKIELPSEIKNWVKEYEKVGERSDYIWKWLYRMFQIVHLFKSPDQYKRSLWRDKVLITIFVAQLDDVADKTKDKTLLNELLKIPQMEKDSEPIFSSNGDKKYFDFTLRIWNRTLSNIKKYPRFKEFREVFYFDINQVLNAVKYSYLVNTNTALINKTEYLFYLPYNMVTMVYSILDLMCSNNFEVKNLGTLREILIFSQRMARIGNWVSTWEREIQEGDFTNGIIAYGVKSSNIDIKEFKELSVPQKIEKIKNSGLERKLLKEWEEYYNKILERHNDPENFIDIKEFSSRLKKFLGYHLISVGFK